MVALSSIYDIARSITKLYVDEGYPLSLAYLPIQEIDCHEIDTPEDLNNAIKAIGSYDY